MAAGRASRITAGTVSAEARLNESKTATAVEPGDRGYWQPGRAFCIFFGPTPRSRGGEIRPASPVNVVGRIVRDPKIFKTVSAGARVTLRRVA